MTEGYRALRHGVAWLDLSARGRIYARGRDRARYLHNLTSNDIKKLTPGAGCYAFLLTAQGRIVADAELYCLPDAILIDTEPELREKAIAQLRKYKVADQVELDDVTETTVAIGVEGPELASVKIPDGYTVAPFSITGQPGFRVYCESGKMGELVAAVEAAGAIRATAEDARAVRIENGKPRYGEDIVETSLPQETRQMHGVSFTKGCYLGQEIVERIRARGQVNRELVRVELEGVEPVAPGMKVTIDGRETEITSSVWPPETQKVIALGYARVLKA